MIDCLKTNHLPMKETDISPCFNENLSAVVFLNDNNLTNNPISLTLNLNSLNLSNNLIKNVKTNSIGDDENYEKNSDTVEDEEKYSIEDEENYNIDDEESVLNNESIIYIITYKKRFIIF